MKGIKEESPNNRGDDASTKHPNPLRKVSSAKNGLHPVWPKGFHETPKSSQTIAKAVGCSLQPDGKALLI